jgi:hypothetical protein
MSELVSLISSYGPTIVIVAAVIFVVLQGEFQFRYPRSGKKP